MHSAAVWGRPLKGPTRSSSTVPAVGEIPGYLWQEMFSHFVPMPCMSNVPRGGEWRTVLRHSSGFVPCITGPSHSAFSIEIYSKAWTVPSGRGFKAHPSISKMGASSSGGTDAPRPQSGQCPGRSRARSTGRCCHTSPLGHGLWLFFFSNAL